jgi:peptidoglycan-associated lipoprotein
MMNKSLLASVVLAAMLAACSSKAVKEAPVVDKTPSTPTVTESAKPATADDSATTTGATQSDMSVNPLKDPNNILSKRSVYFDYDKDEVKTEYRPLVEAHAKYLVANPSAKVFIQGNSDERGTREYNLSLGQRRAVAVKKILSLLGVQDKQIETVSFGEEKANPGCKDEACYQQNRHADFAYENE